MLNLIIKINMMSEEGVAIVSRLLILVGKPQFSDTWGNINLPWEDKRTGMSV